MAGRLSLWGAQQMLTSYLSRETAPLPSLYLALIRGIAPTPYVSGAELDEPEGAGYARVEIPSDVGYWYNDVQPHILATRQDTVFAPATDDWGPIRFWALCDSLVDGQIFAVGSMEDTNEVDTGDVAVVGSGDISIALGPFYDEAI